jgi:hypothetical protein
LLGWAASSPLTPCEGASLMVKINCVCFIGPEIACVSPVLARVCWGVITYLQGMDHYNQIQAGGDVAQPLLGWLGR